MEHNMENINASIVIFKNGDQVICDLKEIYDGEGETKKGICLLMVHPYKLSLVTLNNEDPNQDLQLRFSKWSPYSSNVEFKIPYDSIISLGTAENNLRLAYINRVNELQEYMQQVQEPTEEIIESVETDE